MTTAKSKSEANRRGSDGRNACARFSWQPRKSRDCERHAPIRPRVRDSRKSGEGEIVPPA